MSRNKSHESIKKLFNDPRIPQEIDISHQVMTKIKREKERFFVKYKVSILVAIGLIASISSGYAAVQYYQLKSPQGEVLYQEKDISQYEGKSKIVKEVDPETDALYNKRWEIEDSLEPGTAAALYIVANNPKKLVFTVSTPFSYTTLADVQKKVGEGIVVPKTLPGGFTFLDAQLANDIKNQYDKEALYKQAEKEKKEFVMQPLEWMNELDYMYATYKDSAGSYLNFNITNYEDVEGNTTYVVDLDNQKKEVIKVGKIEVLYTEEARKDQVSKRIVWVTEASGKKLQYEISTDGDKLNKDTISEFVHAVVPKNK
ncbi:hypothetical protein GPJ61_14245 [Brevibacillus formosus]|uniref:hypothetical protein n=1 Tax=Brevibacillus formosus TaxID=54913 RepID=UPI001CA55CC8|nr:hypothetical protein [Brevibacillus formosus]MBW5469023.1 hypothetical protein [Brevibacillus formosus]